MKIYQRKIALLAFFLCTSANTAFACENNYLPWSYLSRDISNMCFLEKDTNRDPQGRGCCSWHQGVCGCQFGRALCCDGTLSPSCGC